MIIVAATFALCLPFVTPMFEVFGNDGYYLYTGKLPFIPTCIKDGFLYHSSYNEESGQVKVIRYRIKNWDRLKSAVN